MTSTTPLMAVVSVDGVASSASPGVDGSPDCFPAQLASLAVTASSLTIAGFGFDTNTAHDTVTFTNGVTGTVTQNTATLTVDQRPRLVTRPIRGLNGKCYCGRHQQW